MAKNIADLFEHAVDVVPERIALVCKGERLTYAELEARANRLAHHLSECGVGAGDHVGLYARNVVEHVVAMLAVFKVRAVGINVNYRYVEGELDYLFRNSDMVALIHERQYAPLVAKVVGNHPGLRHLVVIEDGSDHDTSSYGAVSWADATSGRSSERDFGPRSADDLYIVYTGGTTGYPKGVMWRQEDVWRTLGGGIDFRTKQRLEEFDQSRQALTQPQMVCFPLGPIMHANGQWGMLLRLFGGHTNVLTPRFDPTEIWRLIDGERVNTLSMIGDAMARPLIEEYQRGYDGSSLTMVTSAAAIFSGAVKARWVQTFPDLVITDVIGSSETGFTGTGVVNRDSLDASGPLVSMGADTVVLDDDGQLLDPVADVGAVGRMARGGSVPLGYYKDPDKSARTFVEIAGERYAVPGDYVRIEPGGRLTLIGRGSTCINTGGEKVYPEEVEIALKSHPDVFDALVVGTPDDRYGQRVTAVVQAREGREPTLAELADHLRPLLSGYKLPRCLTLVAEIPRHATGKADYKVAQDLAMAGDVGRV